MQALSQALLQGPSLYRQECGLVQAGYQSISGLVGGKPAKGAIGETPKGGQIRVAERACGWSAADRTEPNFGPVRTLLML
jgi:hypothetical protein